MATFSSYSPGQFCWIDLMSKDMSEAKAFYAGVFGWDAADQQTQNGPPYANFMLQGNTICGLGEMNEPMKAAGMPPVWNSYISVADVDAATAKAAQLGGTVALPVMPVVEAGRLSVIQDPTGAFVSLWEPKEHYGAQLTNVPNAWCWNELMTPDPAAAQAFFADLFGWTYEKSDGAPRGYWNIRQQDRLNGGMLQITEDMGQIPPAWIVYINVADLDATVRSITSAGGALCFDPFEVSVGRIAMVNDAQGAAFALIQMSVPPDE
jgi:uncharacterized protein